MQNSPFCITFCHILTLFAEPAVGAAISSSAGVPLVWVYPVISIAEAPMVHSAYAIACKAKSTLRRELDIKLQGLVRLPDCASEVFTYELVLSPEDGGSATANGSASVATSRNRSDEKGGTRKLLQQSLTVQPLQVLLHIAELFRTTTYSESIIQCPY